MNAQGVFSLALLFGVATLLPALVLLATSFVKISVVLSSLRSAFGTPDFPGRVVVLGLSAILTLHVMAPTASAVLDAAGPALAQAASSDPSTAQGAAAWATAWERGKAPVVRFLKVNARPEDKVFFCDLARRSRAQQARAGLRVEAVNADDVTVLLPAFVVSELTRAMMVVFLVLLPFLVVDLVVANVLLAAGLHAMSPASVSLPFKLLLFVMADGWRLLAQALVLAYR